LSLCLPFCPSPLFPCPCSCYSDCNQITYYMHHIIPKVGSWVNLAAIRERLWDDHVVEGIGLPEQQHEHRHGEREATMTFRWCQAGNTCTYTDQPLLCRKLLLHSILSRLFFVPACLWCFMKFINIHAIIMWIQKSLKTGEKGNRGGAKSQEW
jgi:hypothetical protein